MHVNVLTSCRLNDGASGKHVGIVLDNAGFEVFTDLCLAHSLVATGLASKVRCCECVHPWAHSEQVTMHVKRIPWFVSDVTMTDFEWVLAQLEGACAYCCMSHSFTAHVSSADANLKHLHALWAGHLKSGTWVVREVRTYACIQSLVLTRAQHPFWTLPHDFNLMTAVAPDLHVELSTCALVIFKGSHP